MPIPAQRLNTDGSLLDFGGGPAGADFSIKSRGIRDGSGGKRSLKMGSTTRRIPLLYEPLIDDPSELVFWDAMCFLMGAAVLYNDADTGKLKISRLMPWTPVAETRLGITEIDVKGLAFAADQDAGQTLPIATYTALDLDCTAEILPFELHTDGENLPEYNRYVQVLPDVPSATYLNLPGATQQLKFHKDGGGDPEGFIVPYNTGMPFIKAQVRRKWFRVPRRALDKDSALFKRLYGDPASADPAVRRPYIGSCNKTDFWGFAAGTLILLAPETEVVYDQVASEDCLNITYVWDWLPNGANYLYYFKTPATGGTSGWYLASRGAAFAATAALGDDDVLAYPREHTDIFNVGTVP